jgi:chromosome partitioning protein
MRRVAFVNEKGGTCKTTLAVNLAAYLAQKGRRVLLVDLDTQGHAGKSLGVDVRGLGKTVYDLLLDARRPVESVVIPDVLPGLDLLPANKALSEFPLAAAYDRERSLRLSRRLDEVEDDYDYALIDAPPSSGLFISSALMAATDVVIPVSTTYLALDGCAEVAASIEQLRQQHGRDDLTIAMIVPTLYRKTALADEVIAKLREHHADKLSATTLATCVQLDEAQSHGQTIFEYAPRSKGARMLSDLGLELIARLEVGNRRNAAFEPQALHLDA